jgi:hypothetical protein
VNRRLRVLQIADAKHDPITHARVLRRNKRPHDARARVLVRKLGIRPRTCIYGARVTIRFGHLKRLPREYVGKRHTILARQLPSNGDQEWVEFEEVPGPDPKPAESTGCQRGHPIASRMDVMFVKAYPEEV